MSTFNTGNAFGSLTDDDDDNLAFNLDGSAIGEEEDDSDNLKVISSFSSNDNEDDDNNLFDKDLPEDSEDGDSYADPNMFLNAANNSDDDDDEINSFTTIPNGTFSDENDNDNLGNNYSENTEPQSSPRHSKRGRPRKKDTEDNTSTGNVQTQDNPYMNDMSANNANNSSYDSMPATNNSQQMFTSDDNLNSIDNYSQQYVSQGQQFTNNSNGYTDNSSVTSQSYSSTSGSTNYDYQDASQQYQNYSQIPVTNMSGQQDNNSNMAQNQQYASSQQFSQPAQTNNYSSNTVANDSSSSSWSAAALAIPKPEMIYKIIAVSDMIRNNLTSDDKEAVKLVLNMGAIKTDEISEIVYAVLNAHKPLIVSLDELLKAQAMDEASRAFYLIRLEDSDLMTIINLGFKFGANVEANKSYPDHYTIAETADVAINTLPETSVQLLEAVLTTYNASKDLTNASA